MTWRKSSLCSPDRRCLSLRGDKDRNLVRLINGIDHSVVFPVGFVRSPSLIVLWIFFVLAAGTLSLQALLRARLKWASTMLLMSPWK